MPEIEIYKVEIFNDRQRNTSKSASNAKSDNCNDWSIASDMQFLQSSLLIFHWLAHCTAFSDLVVTFINNPKKSDVICKKKVVTQ
eukprot:Awhi_evm1s5873